MNGSSPSTINGSPSGAVVDVVLVGTVATMVEAVVPVGDVEPLGNVSASTVVVVWASPVLLSVR